MTMPDTPVQLQHSSDRRWVFQFMNVSEQISVSRFGGGYYRVIGGLSIVDLNLLRPVFDQSILRIIPYISRLDL